MPESKFVLESSAFEPNGEMPDRHTCEGTNISPPLRWKGVPEGTKSFALIVEDPDAPDPKAPERIWAHWLVYNIPPTVNSLNEGATLPAGAETGLNDWRHSKWEGPCPPIGKHRYFHKLYALDTGLKFDRPPQRGQLEKAMAGHILGQAELVGVYKKHG